MTFRRRCNIISIYEDFYVSLDFSVPDDCHSDDLPDSAAGGRCSGQAKPTVAPYPTTDPDTLSALPKGDRLLSIDITEGKDGDFDVAFALA